MFVELSNILSRGTGATEQQQGKLVLLIDSNTDGSFLVHHHLSASLKANRKVCFLGFAQSFSHYSSVAQKMGVSLAAAKEQGQLVFLEGLKSSLELLSAEDTAAEKSHPLQFLSFPSADMKSLYDYVQSSLLQVVGSEWKEPVLIIDDLSILLSLGLSTGHILDFIHYCRASICLRLKGDMVALVHSDDQQDEENELLVKWLHHQSSLVIQAEGLSTGYCKDIHGQVKITWREPPQTAFGSDVTELYQYKLLDKNVSFFARGTSAAVL
ncbi:elongator complex protein 6 isoform X2 [Protopterus annectens]|uniref:elongator complex protein 6 isoform X2 n=1 Tax=Protopterus annectens TaxID=7888 RepID=UPI001CFAD719|nr:elongator complex protein 6 isoform X2 [Protopterus annectens]